MIRIAILLVISTVGLAATFVSKSFEINSIAMGSAALLNCGHIEYKTDYLTRTKHIVEVYSCDGDITGRYDLKITDAMEDWSNNNANAESYTRRPKVCGMDNGFVIVYVNNDTDPKIIIKMYNLNGIQIGGEIADVNAYHHDVAMLTEGRVIVTWHRVVSYEVFVSVYAGVTKSLNKEKISQFGNRPRVSPLRDGGWIVVYENHFTGNIGGHIAVSGQSMRELPPLTAEWTQTDKNANRNDDFPRVQGLQTSIGFLLAWHHGGRVYSQVFDDLGKNTSSIFELTHPDNAGLNNNRIPPMGVGIGRRGLDGYVLTWREVGPKFWGSLVQEYSNDGHPLALRTIGDFTATDIIPFPFQTSAGYGVDFRALFQNISNPTVMSYATCDDSSASMCSSGYFHKKNICSTYPCKESSCCNKQTFGVDYDGEVLNPFAVDNTDASLNVEGLHLISIQSMYSDMSVFIPPTPVNSGSSFRLKCDSETISCTFIIVVYDCPPCSDISNREFIESLPKMGFTEVGGSPKFRMPGSTASYPMRSFELSIPMSPTNERLIDVSVLSNVRYVAVFAKQGIVTGIPPVSNTVINDDCSFPALFPEMVGFMNDFSKFSKLGN